MTNDEKRDMDIRADMAEFAARQRRQEKIITFLSVTILIMAILILFSLIRSDSNVTSPA